MGYYAGNLQLTNKEFIHKLHDKNRRKLIIKWATNSINSPSL